MVVVKDEWGKERHQGLQGDVAKPIGEGTKVEHLVGGTLGGTHINRCKLPHIFEAILWSG